MRKTLLPAFIPISAPASLKDMAFQIIKNAIMNNQLEPGKVYNGSELAQQRAVSNTSVREALLDLATRGFIMRLPVSFLPVEWETRFDFAKGFPGDHR